MEVDINAGTEDDMNLENDDDDEWMHAFEKLAKTNAVTNGSK